MQLSHAVCVKLLIAVTCHRTLINLLDIRDQTSNCNCCLEFYWLEVLIEFLIIFVHFSKQKRKNIRLTDY